MAVMVHLSKPKPALMVHVRSGLLGPAGVTALQIVTVESNHELVNVKMETRMNVQDQQYTNSSAIDNRAIQECSIGMTVWVMQMGGKRFTINTSHLVKQCSIDVPHIVYRSQAALLLFLCVWNISLINLPAVQTAIKYHIFAI